MGHLFHAVVGEDGRAFDVSRCAPQRALVLGLYNKKGNEALLWAGLCRGGVDAEAQRNMEIIIDVRGNVRCDMIERTPDVTENITVGGIAQAGTGAIRDLRDSVDGSAFRTHDEFSVPWVSSSSIPRSLCR